MWPFTCPDSHVPTPYMREGDIFHFNIQFQLSPNRWICLYASDGACGSLGQKVQIYPHHRKPACGTGTPAVFKGLRQQCTRNVLHAQYVYMRTTSTWSIFVKPYLCLLKDWSHSNITTATSMHSIHRGYWMDARRVSHKSSPTLTFAVSALPLR